MSNFKVPLVWQMYGCLDVEAETIQEAIEYALGSESLLPEGSYLDESVEIAGNIIEINPCNEMPLGADQNQMDESDKDTEGRYFMEDKANG